MALPFRRILAPVDLDENSLAALEVAAHLARQSAAEVYLLHVVGLAIPPGEAPFELETLRPREEAARDKLREIAARQLAQVTHHLETRIGDPATAIVMAANTLAADLIVMATHGRRGIARMLLGSVAEKVVRESHCPVLTVRAAGAREGLVRDRMTPNPVTAAPEDTLAEARARMHAGRFRSLPVLDHGELVGIITDRDIRRYAGRLENTAVKTVMTERPMTVGPDTSVWDAARLVLEHKIGGLPVVEDGVLVGIVTTSDLLKELVASAH